MNKITKILQLTDLHLFSSPKTKLIGINSYQSLQQVMLLVTKEITKKQPDLLALTGDISQDYSIESHEVALKFFKNLNCTIAATMGNHDYLPLFVDFFGDPTQDINKIFDIDGWRILFLNSYWHEHVGGQLSQQELSFLQKTLDASLKKHVMIFLHHPILQTGSAWLDKIITSNASQFLEIIDKYKNIKAVVCGHIHQETCITRLGVNYLSTPATSWQFSVNSDDFKLDTLMPGYRWIYLYEDGTFKTEIVRIDYNASFIPDMSSKGY